MSLRDPGQIQKIRDCPGDSGTVGAYVTVAITGPAVVLSMQYQDVGVTANCWLSS